MEMETSIRKFSDCVRAFVVVIGRFKFISSILIGHKIMQWSNERILLNCWKKIKYEYEYQMSNFFLQYFFLRNWECES